MCGILGVLNGEKGWAGLSDLNKYMKQGAVVGTLRGDDSTGIFQVKRSGVVQVHKLALPGGMFAETKRAREILNAVDNSSCTILHHRAATRGVINHENAHPFEHSDSERYLVGVHNGSLHNAKTKYDGIDFDVDSDYAYYRIFKDGPAAFKDFDGAYAMVWYENDGKLRVATNGQRQFSFAPVIDKNIILIASEAGMLYWLASRNDMKLEAIVTPEPYNMLTFDLNGDLRKFESETIEKHVTEVYSTNRNFPYRTRQEGGASGASTTQTSAGASGTTNVKLIDPTSDSSFLKYGLEPGMEVEFFPDIKESQPLTLRGDVLIEGSSCETVPAILSLQTAEMYNNIKAGSVDSIISTIRSETFEYSGTRKTSVLLLGKVNAAIGREGIIQTLPTPTVKGPKGQFLSHSGFLALVDGGCMNCKEVITISQGINSELGWSGNKPICLPCLNMIAAEAV